MRRGFIHNESPLATPKSSKSGVPDAANEPMDEWELKLLGKKGGKYWHFSSLSCTKKYKTCNIVGDFKH